MLSFLLPMTIIQLLSGDILEGKAPTQTEINAAIKKMQTDESQADIDKAAEKAALLDKLGITEDEAKLLLS
jgi:post-segregation antitoxin (ccd killing protein)